MRPPLDFGGELLDPRAVHAAAGALVSTRRIGEAIADDPVAARERRPNEVFEVQRLRAANISRVSVGGVIGSPCRSSTSWRTRSASGVPPGSRVERHAFAARLQPCRARTSRRWTCRPLRCLPA